MKIQQKNASIAVINMIKGGALYLKTKPKMRETEPFR